MKKISLLLFFLLSFFCIYGEPQKIFSIDRYSELYTDLEFLQREAGISQLSHTYPFTSNEIEIILNKIDYSTLSVNSKELYNNVLNKLELSKDESGFRSNYSLQLNAETYLQTNKENENWIYGYNSRKPIAEVDLSFGINNFLWADIALPFQKGEDFYRYSSGAESNISLLWNTNQIDAQFPFLAITSLGGKNWNFQIGRDLLNYGVGNTGVFVISDDGSYHDYVRLSTFWDKFKYSLSFVNIDPIDVDGLDPYVVYTEVKDSNGETVLVETSESRKKLKVFIDHAFEFRPIDQFSITIHEVTVRGGGELTIGWFNPLMIMHNLALPDRKYTIFGNSLSTISTSITPIKKLSIYGEFALDQFETPSEEERLGEEGSGDPNAFGWLAGVNYRNFNFEYAYTNPHLYRSTNSWSIYALTRWYHSIYNDSNDPLVEPLGYKYGPDVSLFKISGDFNLFSNKLDLYAEYMYIMKGEKELTDYADSGSEAFNLTSPSGDYIKKSIITLSADYRFNTSLSAYCMINTLFMDITDYQFILGASYKF